jgi:hypothetical protein
MPTFRFFAVVLSITLPVAASASAETAAISPEARQHWAFRRVHCPPVPAIKDAAWLRTPLDAFVLSKLEAKGLRPSPETDRAALIRRVYFDLIGLPPPPDEMERARNDQRPDWYENLVERLLASPQYGERWARHWLDVARYADSKGYVFTEERRYPYAYTYRDYVVAAFNNDLPYDQFIVQQLAADKLPLGADKGPLAAMGFLTLGRRFLNSQPDIIDDRIDVVTRGLLGLTVTCARCHDHKFDPIPTQDYYSFYGVFANSVEPKDPPMLRPPEANAAYAAFEKELKAREEEITRLKVTRTASRIVGLHLPGTAVQIPLAAVNRAFQRADRDKDRALQKRVEQWKATSPLAPPRPMMLEDAPHINASHVFVRGNPGNVGEEVPRRFLAILSPDKREPFHEGSGRLELAKHIASNENPLTARVLVNRVWAQHFGQCLVRSPSNFGLRGDAPANPELLDYLAWRFMEDGWSIKKLHRLILLSATYRQSSEDNEAKRKIDPDNSLFWHMNRQRLDFEALRDAMLAVAGRLEPNLGGPAVELTKEPFSGRRTLYGFIDRQNLPGIFRTFDFACPDTHSPQRFITTVPQQALFLMNSPFVVEQGRRVVAQLHGEPTEARIRHLYQLTYSRDATDEEIAMGKQFLASAADAKLSPWERYAQVLLLSNEFVFVD